MIISVCPFLQSFQRQVWMSNPTETGVSTHTSAQDNLNSTERSRSPGTMPTEQWTAGPDKSTQNLSGLVPNSSEETEVGRDKGAHWPLCRSPCLFWDKGLNSYRKYWLPSSKLIKMLESITAMCSSAKYLIPTPWGLASYHPVPVQLIHTEGKK